MLRLDGIIARQGAFELRADWALATGTVTAVIGPSGGGKSTLLNVIGGFLAPSRGRLLWNGQDITALPPDARPLSMMFQDQNLFPHLSVFRNAALGLRPDLRLTEDQHAQVRAALAAVGLQGLDDRLPAALSGGQQGRLALARTLLRARPLLLLDEAFAALGPALRDDMLDLLSAMAAERQMTVLFVTHDPQDARRIAAQTVVVAGGTACPPAETAALLDSPPPLLAAYLGGRHRA